MVQTSHTTEEGLGSSPGHGIQPRPQDPKLLMSPGVACVSHQWQEMVLGNQNWEKQASVFSPEKSNPRDLSL